MSSKPTTTAQAEVGTTQRDAVAASKPGKDSSRWKPAYGRWTRYSDRIECFDVRSDQTDERPSGRAAGRERRERAAFGPGVNGAPHGRALRGTDGPTWKPTETAPFGVTATEAEAAGPERPSGRDGAGAKPPERTPPGERDGEAERLDRTGWPRNDQSVSAERSIRGLRAFWHGLFAPLGRTGCSAHRCRVRA